MPGADYGGGSGGSGGASPWRSPLHTVHVDAIGGWGGGQAQIAGLVRGLLRRGHRALVVTRPGSALGRRLGEVVPVVQMPLASNFDLASWWRLLVLFRRLQPEVVHLHSPVAHTLGGAAARLAGVPVVIAHKRTDFRPTPGRLNRWRFCGMVDRVIAVSAASRQTTLALGLPSSSVQVIYSGVDTEHYRPGTVAPACPGVPDGVPLIVAVGALQQRKGHDTLIRAFSRLPPRHADTWLALVGEGEQRQQLQAVAAESGVGQRVVFTGDLEDVRPVLARCRVAVMPSHMEALGVAGLEAMAMARPLVASRTGGLAEMVQDGVTGLLVPPGDPQALAEALARLLANPDQAEEMGRRGRQRVAACFSMEQTVAQTEALYLELLAQARG